MSEFKYYAPDGKKYSAKSKEDADAHCEQMLEKMQAGTKRLYTEEEVDAMLKRVGKKSSTKKGGK